MPRKQLPSDWGAGLRDLHAPSFPELSPCVLRTTHEVGLWLFCEMVQQLLAEQDQLGCIITGASSHL